MTAPNILIVEDEYIVARQLQFMLNDMGYEARSLVAKGEAALELLSREPRDLVLMDIRLAGELDGIQTAEQINQRYQTPIVFLTAHGDPGNIQKAKATHPYAFLIKPCTAKDLQPAVELALMRDKLAKSDQMAQRVWQDTFDAVPDLVFTLDETCTIQKVNRAVVERLNSPASSLIGRSCHDVMHDMDAHPDHCPLAMSKGMDSEYRIERWESKLGGYFISTISPIRDPEDKLMGYVHVFRDITERRRAEEEREKLVVKLEAALREVKTLSGMLPICSNCKNIRDDQGYWKEIEDYIVNHSDAIFSHGICPECIQRLYPDYVDESEE